MGGIPAVLVGLDSMQGLQVARILSARGVRVVGVAGNERHYATRTNACERVVFSDLGSRRLIDALQQLDQDVPGPKVLIPCQDGAVLQVSEHRQALELLEYRFALPEHAAVLALYDKYEFSALASDAGLNVPKTIAVTNPEDLPASDEEFPFPAVVKPITRVGDWSKHTKAKAVKVADAAELTEVHKTVGGWVETLLVQQWIDGPESNLYSFNGFYDRESELQAGFTARKIRQYPPQVGQSCFGEEVEAPEVAEAAARLFKAVSMYGLAYLEMKKDDRSGVFYAVEPNIGRPTGRSAIAEAGGVELHYTAYASLAGLPLPEARTQTFKGARWVHLLRDCQTAFSYWRNGTLSLGSWLADLRGPKAYAVWSRKDPMPFLGALWQGLVDAIGKGEQRSYEI